MPVSSMANDAALRRSLEGLDPASHALLELSLGRGLSDGDIAEILGGDPGAVAAQRAEVIERIADDLGVRGDFPAVRALREDLRSALGPPGARARARRRGSQTPHVEPRRTETRAPDVETRRTPPRADPSRVPTAGSDSPPESAPTGGRAPWLAGAQAAALARERRARPSGAGGREGADSDAPGSEIERLGSERGEPTPLLQKGELSARRVRGLWRVGAVAAAVLALAVMAIVLFSRGGEESPPGPAEGRGGADAEPMPAAPEPRVAAPRAEGGRPPARGQTPPREPRVPIPEEGVEVTMTRPGAAPGSGGPSGTARLSRQAGTTRLRVSLAGLPNPKGRYELWLYDSRRRVVSVTSFATPLAVVDSVLEEDPRRYRYVDLSVEPPNGDPGHSVQSVLRAPVAELLEP